MFFKVLTLNRLKTYMILIEFYDVCTKILISVKLTPISIQYIKSLRFSKEYIILDKVLILYINHTIYHIFYLGLFYGSNLLE